MASLKNALGLQELTDKRSNLIRSLISEFFGTMLLNFFGCGAVVTNNVVAISLSFGLIVAGAIQAIGHVSGGHINPAVTFGLLAIGKISVIRAVLYVLVQSAGAIVGSITLKALSADSMESSLGDVKLADGMEPLQGFGIELFLGLILVLVVCGACDPGKPESKGIAPLIIGLAVTVGHIVAIPRTGSGMNPARALGSAVVKGEYMNHWVYWIGPIIGGIIGSLIYTHVIGRNNNTNSSRSYNTVATDEKELQQLSARSKGAQSA